MIEVVPGADVSGVSSLDVRYIRPEALSLVGEQQSQVDSAGNRRLPKALERMTGEVAESGVLTSPDTEGTDKDELQAAFDCFFSQMVSEWNPIYTEEGQ